MTEREKILGRIQEALTTLAPQPGGHGWKGSAGPRAAATTAREWLPFVGHNWAAQLDLFARNSAELKTMFLPCESLEAAQTMLRKLATQAGWQRLATHGTALAALFAQMLNLPRLNTDDGYATSELERCDASITECDALIAQTGSVLLTTRSGGGRALSVLPPHHVVIARHAQLLPDLPAAYALLHQRYSAAWPSFMTLITGPSRTADIERILVLGAHGPKRLTIFLIPD